MELLELLKSRLEIAKTFTKEFQEEVSLNVEDYELENQKIEGVSAFDPKTRYSMKIPYIFATHESMVSSMFDQPPELVFKGKGRLDDDKKDAVLASYEYLKDVCDIELFMNVSAWWFILCGWTSSNAFFKTETREIPLVDEMTGEVMLDDFGEPAMRTEYVFNDPVLEIDNPLKVFWSPESKFSEDGEGVPYRISEALMEVDVVKEIYGKKVDADGIVEIKGDDQDKADRMSDLKRAKVYFYIGTIPKDSRKGCKNWTLDRLYHIAFTDKLILDKEPIESRTFRIGKWHGVPTKFFGFGIGTTLHDSQKDMSIRAGQMRRYADIAAFPKVAMDAESDVDEDALQDPRALPVLLYRGQPPQYLSPPDLSNTLLIAEEKSRENAQFISGQLDIAKGAQSSNTVKTATGQQIFADSANKRINQAKKQFTRYYREVVIMLLKLAQKYWDDEKIIALTDIDGDREIAVDKYSLADIDFDKDIDISAESLSVNKDVLRAQSIEMYNMTKDDPIVDRAMVFKDLMKEGFGKNNPENYITEQGQPMGQPMAEPTGSPDIPTNQTDVVGQSQVL